MTEETVQQAPVRRAYQVYLYAVCFVTVLVALFAAAESVYGLFRIITPETTAAGELGFGSFDPGAIDPDETEGLERFLGAGREAERKRGTAQFIQAGLIAGAAALVFRWHHQQATALRAELEGAARPPSTSPPPAESLVISTTSEAAPPADIVAPTKPVRRRPPAAPRKRRT